jgi:hypothetical protein
MIEKEITLDDNKALIEKSKHPSTLELGIIKIPYGPFFLLAYFIFIVN